MTQNGGLHVESWLYLVSTVPEVLRWLGGDVADADDGVDNDDDVFFDSSLYNCICLLLEQEHATKENLT